MTTTIALETSKGNFGLALGLGFILIGITVAVSAAAFVRRPVSRAPGCANSGSVLKRLMQLPG